MICGYIRCSAGEKQDASRQRKSIEAWASRCETPIAHWFEDTVGKNPRDQSAKRPQFQRLLKAVESGLVKTIVCDSQDRFGTKNAHEFGKFASLLAEHGCTLLDSSGRDLASDDDAAILQSTVGALTSTREQKEKAHRSVSAKIQHAKAGQFTGGYPPYGLDVVCFGADGKEKWRSVYYEGHHNRAKVYPNGKREAYRGKNNSPTKDQTDTLRLRPTIEKDRLAVVKKIFKWFATELISPSQIATRLRESGTPSLYADWHKIAIDSILKNPVYIGRPAWGKRGAARFVEYVDGRVQSVKKGQKAGRRRLASDYVQPDEQQFPPIIPLGHWEAAQAKINNRKGKRYAPRSPDLWLKPFLVCGKCGQTMRAACQQPRLGPSYFCSSYGTYGRNNPTGCRCHRVQGHVIHAMVDQFLKDTGRKIDQLTEAAESTDVEFTSPLVMELASAVAWHADVAESVYDFVVEYMPERKRRADKRPWAEIYADLYPKVRPRLEKAIAEKESELDQEVEKFRDLSPKLRERANARMESMLADLDALKAKAVDLQVPWTSAQAELDMRRTALEKARKMLRGDQPRAKMEALQQVIDKIVCHFSYNGKDGQPTEKKSFLERVEIHPVSGDCAIFPIVAAPGPG